MPKVSVLMPVYNGEKYIAQAIDSILAQSFRDFELLVIDDGSTDRSAEIIASYSDKRVRYVANPSNLGLADARNRAIEVSSGNYLAWLDCDDISLPERLLKQVNLLDANPKLGLCGTWVRTLGLNSEQVWQYPSDPEFVRGRMLFDDPLATSAAMTRRSCLPANELRFDTRFPPAEDYDLWERISRMSEVSNVPEILTLYRVHPAQTSVLKAEKQKTAIWTIQNRILEQLGIVPTDDDMRLHLDIGVGWKFLSDMNRVKATEQWLLKLEKANRQRTIFPERAFRCVLAERWFLAVSAVIPSGIKAWATYHQSSLSHWGVRRFWMSFRLFTKCIRYGL